MAEGLDALSCELEKIGAACLKAEWSIQPTRLQRYADGDSGLLRHGLRLVRGPQGNGEKRYGNSQRWPSPRRSARQIFYPAVKNEMYGMYRTRAKSVACAGCKVRMCALQNGIPTAASARSFRVTWAMRYGRHSRNTKRTWKGSGAGEVNITAASLPLKIIQREGTLAEREPSVAQKHSLLIG